jgi:amino acid permease
MEALQTEPEASSIHEDGLRHQLSAGQMAMVAVGGSIATGLLLGSGAAMEVAGPAAILSFIAAAFITGPSRWRTANWRALIRLRAPSECTAIST